MVKILLVDDDHNIRIATKWLLEGEGYEVVLCNDVNECLKLLREKNIDLVLLDVIMSGYIGWDVCKKIKENKETKHMPVVMFTVCTTEADKKKSFEYSMADAQVDKPFKNEELLATIEEVLDNSKNHSYPVHSTLVIL